MFNVHSEHAIYSCLYLATAAPENRLLIKLAPTSARRSSSFIRSNGTAYQLEL